MATVLYRQGQFASGLIHIEKAIEIDGTKAAYYANQGNLLAALKRYTAAERAYRTALNIEPENPIAKSRFVISFSFFSPSQASLPVTLPRA